MTRGVSETFVTTKVNRENSKRTKIEIPLFAEKRILDQ